MEKSCAGLLEILRRQLEVYRRVLSLAVEKKPVLVKGDIPALDRITKEEELLIVEVGRLEEQRRNVHHALANHFSLSPDELSMSELIKQTDEETGAKFQQIFAEMTGVLQELENVNQGNADLIKNSLDYINFSINLLTDTDRTPAYGADDGERKQNTAKIFDRKI